VARQYTGTLGKQDNCQVAVSLHYAAPGGDYPLALRLYLPESWTCDPARLDEAHVPESERTFQEKWRMALALLDEVRAEGLPHQAVLADAGYGEIGPLRQELERRSETYLVGLNGTEVVHTVPQPGRESGVRHAVVRRAGGIRWPAPHARCRCGSWPRR
jgi:SRSO17 transposase